MPTSAASPLAVPVFARPPALASRPLSKNSQEPPSPPPQDSPLLRSIRQTLRAARSAQDDSVRSLVYQPFGEVGPDPGEELLAWDTYNVTLSQGGVLRKKWSFQDPVQWACIGMLLQPSQLFSSTPPTPAYYREDPSEKLPEEDADARRPFSPYYYARMEKKRDEDPDVCIRSVFVFLRGMVKIYFLNGLEHTLNLPFIVRRAWPVEPAGLFVQRVVEAWELEENKQSGAEPLTTVFTLTSPFSEPSVIGLTEDIKSDLTPEELIMKPDYAVRPVSLPPEERILWVSPGGRQYTTTLMVTLSVDLNRITIWRYVHAPPPSTKEPFRRRGATNHTKRTSMSGNTSAHLRNTNAASDDLRLSPDKAESKRTGGAPSGLAPTLTTTTTMEQLMSGGFAAGAISQSQWTLPINPVLDPSAKGDSSSGKAAQSDSVDLDDIPDPSEEARLKPLFWAEKIYEEVIPESATADWENITVALFDQRWGSKLYQYRLGICLRATQSLLLYEIVMEKSGVLRVTPTRCVSATAITPIVAVREQIPDLLVLQPDGDFVLLTHGTHELPLDLKLPDASSDGAHAKQRRVVGFSHWLSSAITLHLSDGTTTRMSLDLTPQDSLVKEVLQMLALTLPADPFFALNQSFLRRWSAKGYSVVEGVELRCFEDALWEVLGLETGEQLGAVHAEEGSPAWQKLAANESIARFREDPALRKLRLPGRSTCNAPFRKTTQKPTVTHAAVLHALHYVAEDRRLSVSTYADIPRLAPIICRLAMVVRPEWADYWKRLCPTAMPIWPSQARTANDRVYERMPFCPPDVTAILYGQLNNPDWVVPWSNNVNFASRFDLEASFVYGRLDPLQRIAHLTSLCKSLTDKRSEGKGKPLDTRSRAVAAIQLLDALASNSQDINRLPLGIAAPIREALRTCQLSPAGDWQVSMYNIIGRNDLAEGLSERPTVASNYGYRSVREFLVGGACAMQVGAKSMSVSFQYPNMGRKTTQRCIDEVNRAIAGDNSNVTGVEIESDDYTRMRFGQDRRLEDVARMLCSATVHHVRVTDRPELSETDKLRDMQHVAHRIVERVLSLPLGRAAFTYSTMTTVTKESFAIPKMEFSVRVQPSNILFATDVSKMAVDHLHWAEFHNGVAAGLRISSQAGTIESSWIKFNRPSDLTPEHAGFLYALGLTGHLREMLTWHTFGYLTPKHDMTSIGVLLGLAAANVGSRNKHVTKLIAVHTPALLPTPDVDLNVPLMTQSAGLMGIGLLYLGTKHRRMAEVCLNQISRRDLYQPDISNEYREAYTLSAALGCGMILLAKGTSTPADLVVQNRLRLLIHGEPRLVENGKTRRPTFDVNITSPAASIALGLMYLRTNRQDVADILTIPETLEGLNSIQPHFLTARIIARLLIMWDTIQPTLQWVTDQLPQVVKEAMDARSKGIRPDDAFELAYYNIVAGACFALGLKYAGSATEDAYRLLLRFWDIYSTNAFTAGAAYDHRIKRAALREGLNLITCGMAMVLAGSGEINCLRRFRYAYGVPNTYIRYGCFTATSMGIGLLFAGGGRFTLGTSDAAIACMVASFYPRFPSNPGDNKAYLQAYRHLWVLAMEPRHLVARDVDTREIAYLPIKAKVKEGEQGPASKLRDVEQVAKEGGKDKERVGTAHLIAPTLIPDIERILSIRVDTPRYWPFYLDVANFPRHRNALLRSQTLFVKRRTAFLTYMEDPKGSRSLFVRPGAGTGDPATLDFPHAADTKAHPATDLHDFIASSSNDPLFLSFADRLCRDDGETQEERIFEAYCHAALLDCMLQDKPQTLQGLLTSFHFRVMSPDSNYFSLRMQDLRFATEFYNKVYDRKFSGRAENNPRPPLMREATLSSALHVLDSKLGSVREAALFKDFLARYARGEGIPAFPEGSPEWMAAHRMSWYLERNSVPATTLLMLLRELAQKARQECLGGPPPSGTTNVEVLETGIKEVVHATGTQMTTAMGSGWSVRSLNEIMEAWRAG
ncbi:hypothetical protein BD413DRAFT_557879 [Trametes elegans]|nr:hypothetical protein BD413DRAFT_557879 [Trametes elegans]